MADDPIKVIFQEFSIEELPLFYLALKERMGWGGRTLVLHSDGTRETHLRSETFEVERYDDELQRRIRSAVDRAEPLLRALDAKGKPEGAGF